MNDGNSASKNGEPDGDEPEYVDFKAVEGNDDRPISDSSDVCHENTRPSAAPTNHLDDVDKTDKQNRENPEQVADTTNATIADGIAMRDSTNKLEAEISEDIGAYKVWVLDKDGDFIDFPTKEHPDRVANPNSSKAVEIFYGVQTGAATSPTTQQIDLQMGIDKVLRACQRLYLGKDKQQLEKFRIYYVRLFYLAQLGLEHQRNQALASVVLSSISADLIEDEAANIKNGYLIRLGRYVSLYLVFPLLLYLILRFTPRAIIFPLLQKIDIDAGVLACFAILWVGCFIGVWLSYGIRKTKISLADLTSSDDDYLVPHIRLIFAGLLTMIIGILFTLQFIKLEIGTISLTDISGSPMLAFLVGLFCGISELALPASIGARAASFIQNIK